MPYGSKYDEYEYKLILSSRQLYLIHIDFKLLPLPSKISVSNEFMWHHFDTLLLRQFKDQTSTTPHTVTQETNRVHNRR